MNHPQSILNEPSKLYETIQEQQEIIDIHTQTFAKCLSRFEDLKKNRDKLKGNFEKIKNQLDDLMKIVINLTQMQADVGKSLQQRDVSIQKLVDRLNVIEGNLNPSKEEVTREQRYLYLPAYQSAFAVKQISTAEIALQNKQIDLKSIQETTPISFEIEKKEKITEELFPYLSLSRLTKAYNWEIDEMKWKAIAKFIYQFTIFLFSITVGILALRWCYLRLTPTLSLCSLAKRTWSDLTNSVTRQIALFSRLLKILQWVS